MAKKKKNIKKKAKQEQKAQLQQQTPEDLIAGAENSLSAGKAREAIELAKKAAKKNGAPETARSLLFRAYIAREKQLRDKGMHEEAEVVNRQAAQWVPDAGELGESDLALFAASAPVRKAFDFYAIWLADAPPSAAVERQLVNRLLQTEQWELIERLDPASPLRKDAGCIPGAVEMMNEGRWEDALAVLRPVSRSSPYAPLRILARAMCAFYAENDKDLIRALSMIPEDFLLHPVAESLAGYVKYKETGMDGPAEGPDERPAKRTDFLKLFFDDAVNAVPEMNRLIRDLKHEGHRNINRKNPGEAARRIETLSRLIYPEDPDVCKKTLIELLTGIADKELLWNRHHSGIAQTMLGRDECNGLEMRMNMRYEFPLQSAADFMSLVHHLIADPRQYLIARSSVLLTALKKSRQRKSANYEIDHYNQYFNPSPWDELGIDPENDIHPYLEMVQEGIQADPENREWYELVAELPARSRAEQKIVEEALWEMAEHFPEDPFPFIELAGFYAGKGAHRKAEKAIEKAAELAPYDNRVIDRKAVLLLNSVRINTRRGKHHLARADLQKAAALESRPAAPFVWEKSLLLDILEAPADAKRIVLKAVSGLDPFERLFRMVLLMMDTFHEHPDTRIFRVVGEQINAGMEAIGESLGASRVKQLLSPIPRAFARVIPPEDPAMPGLFFTPSQLEIMLMQLDDNDIIAAADRVLPTGHQDVVLRDLDRRLSDKEYAECPIIAFYYLVLEDISGNTTDAESIMEIIETASQDNRQLMMEAADRLIPYAEGFLLKKALENFNFRILDPDPWLYDDDDFDDDDDDPFFDDDDTGHVDPAEIFNEMLRDVPEAKLIEMIEDAVDQMGLRGLPEKELLNAKSLISSGAPPGTTLETMFSGVSRKTRKKLSREAKTLFFS